MELGASAEAPEVVVVVVVVEGKVRENSSNPPFSPPERVEV